MYFFLAAIKIWIQRHLAAVTRVAESTWLGTTGLLVHYALLGFFMLKFYGGPHCGVKVFGPRAACCSLDVPVNKREIPGRQWGDVRKSNLITELPFVLIGKTGNVRGMMVVVGSASTAVVRSLGRCGRRLQLKYQHNTVPTRPAIWHRFVYRTLRKQRVQALLPADTNT